MILNHESLIFKLLRPEDDWKPAIGDTSLTSVKSNQVDVEAESDKQCEGEINQAFGEENTTF